MNHSLLKIRSHNCNGGNKHIFKTCIAVIRRHLSANNDSMLNYRFVGISYNANKKSPLDKVQRRTRMEKSIVYIVGEYGRHQSKSNEK